MEQLRYVIMVEHLSRKLFKHATACSVKLVMVCESKFCMCHQGKPLEGMPSGKRTNIKGKFTRKTIFLFWPHEELLPICQWKCSACTQASAFNRPTGKTRMLGLNHPVVPQFLFTLSKIQTSCCELLTCQLSSQTNKKSSIYNLHTIILLCLAPIKPNGAANNTACAKLSTTEILRIPRELEPPGAKQHFSLSWNCCCNTITAKMFRITVRKIDVSVRTYNNWGTW